MSSSAEYIGDRVKEMHADLPNKFVVMCIFNSSCTDVVMMYKTRGPYPCTYNFPGGKIRYIEKDTPSVANFREVHEETGIGFSDFERWDYLCKVTWRSDTEVSYYYGVLKPGVELQQRTSERVEWHKITDVVKECNVPYAGDGDIPFIIRVALGYIEKGKHASDTV